MSPPVIADTGGLLRALARTAVLITAAAVMVPDLVLAEVDHFLRNERKVMRKLIAEIFDSATR